MKVISLRGHSFYLESTVLYWTCCWWQLYKYTVSSIIKLHKRNVRRADEKWRQVLREIVFSVFSLYTYLPAHPAWPESWCRHLYSDRQTDGEMGKKDRRSEVGKKRNKCDRSVKVNRAEMAEMGQITIWNHFWHMRQQTSRNYCDILLKMLHTIFKLILYL